MRLGTTPHPTPKHAASPSSHSPHNVGAVVIQVYTRGFDIYTFRMAWHPTSSLILIYILKYAIQL